MAGTYNVGVWVRDGKHASSTGYDARLIVNGYSVTSAPLAPANQPPTVSALARIRRLRRLWVQLITWRSSAIDPEGDSISYRFWLQSGTGAWVVTQDWSSSNSWSWNPNVAGTYNVGVWVRDGKHASSTGYDARLIVNGYSVTSAPRLRMARLLFPLWRRIRRLLRLWVQRLHGLVQRQTRKATPYCIGSGFRLGLAYLGWSLRTGRH